MEWEEPEGGTFESEVVKLGRETGGKHWHLGNKVGRGKICRGKPHLTKRLGSKGTGEECREVRKKRTWGKNG